MQSGLIYRRHSQLGWDVEGLRSSGALAPGRARSRMYQTRALRYWFVHHFLRIEHQRRERPLSVCEVGIDAGQLRQFLRSVGRQVAECSCWIGVDRRIRRDALAGLGYTACMEEDIERSGGWLTGDHDVVILLHVLEHLYAPEEVVRRLAQRIAPGTALVGGFPSVPNWCIPLREPRIRAHPNANGHVSVFSSHRVRTMAEACGLDLEFLAGAFFLRADGFFLEDHPWWLRFNLAFGSQFPSWPGEIYWVMRKP